MALGKLWSVTLDCADAKQLSRFWAAALDGKIAYESENFSGVELPDGLWIGAYRIDGYEPPQWPDGAPPKQFHLDFQVDDLDAAEQAALELGASKARPPAGAGALAGTARPGRPPVLCDTV